MCPGLMRDKRHAEHALCLALYLVDRTDELDAASLAPSAGMDLRLHDQDRAARVFGKLARRRSGFLDRESGFAAWNGRAERAQNFLGLVLVDVHEVPLLES